LSKQATSRWLVSWPPPAEGVLRVQVGASHDGATNAKPLDAVHRWCAEALVSEHREVEADGRRTVRGVLRREVPRRRSPACTEALASDVEKSRRVIIPTVPMTAATCVASCHKRPSEG